MQASPTETVQSTKFHSVHGRNDEMIWKKTALQEAKLELKALYFKGIFVMKMAK